MMGENMIFPVELRRWFASTDRGISSNAIVEVMEGLPRGMITGSFGLGHPHDPGDFGRCFRLLKLMPEYRSRLDEMRVTPEWSILVNHWSELEGLYVEEAPSMKYPKLYARMQELIDGARKV